MAKRALEDIKKGLYENELSTFEKIFGTPNQTGGGDKWPTGF